MTTSRPRGRRPGHVDTRSEILNAALKMFSEIGYEKVSLRSIAREAGVDPALIHHYFDSKSELFGEAVLALAVPDPASVVAAILDGPRETIGERAAQQTLSTWDVEGAQERFTAMLRAAVSDPGARRPLSEYLSKEIFTKVADALGHTNTKQRGELAVSMIIGFSLGREVLQLPALSRLSRAQQAKALGTGLQAYLVESW